MPAVTLVVGTVFLGKIGTVTADVAVPPLPSVTVIVTVSVVVASGAPVLAEACRATAVGV